MSTIFDPVISFIRSYYNRVDEFIALHEPLFVGNERKYVIDAIDSTYVSSVGKYVDEFEVRMAQYTGAKYAVATVNGTAALHMALLVAGVEEDDLVITQPLSFIATCNAISYIKASPIFIDVDKDTLGLSPQVLREYLSRSATIKDGKCIHKKSGKRISACVPMHTFGHPARIDQIVEICHEFKINVVEDAAEAIGSKYQGRHAGTFGLLGTYSFNGNKTITCGGGGAIVTNNEALAKKAKHLTTQAKIPHRWNFDHDFVGYNYRMPNLNAALACAQLEMLDTFVEAKRSLAVQYQSLFKGLKLHFVAEPASAHSNYWLNAVIMDSPAQRDEFLHYTNDRKIMTRPAWNLMSAVAMFRDCDQSDLSNAQYLADRLVNLPSSPKL